MTGVQIDAVVFAVFIVVGACFVALLFLRITELLLTVKWTLASLTAAVLPLLEQADQAAQTGDAGLVKVAAITDNVQAVTDNVSALSATASSAAGGPLVKTVRFSLGVRSILASRNRPDRAKQVRAELAADRRARRREVPSGGGGDER